MPERPPPPPGSSTSGNPSGSASSGADREGAGERAQRFAETSARAAKVSARAARQSAKASAKAAGAAARGTSTAAKKGARRLRNAAQAQGAGRTGLSRLIEVNAASAFSDALVTIALAGTLFFSVPTGEARPQVALFLLLTMAPFAVVAPIIGPFLDRYRHGRRWAIGFTLAGRGFLAWVLADAVLNDTWMLYPAALGVLVGQKAYAVTRAAAVPRVLPDEIELVTANSRLQLAATLGTLAGVGLGAILLQIGDDWSLRVAFFTYAGATVLAILLPNHVDSAAGEENAPIFERRTPSRKWRLGGSVVRALRANATLRGLSGFLTMFLAFMLLEPYGWQQNINEMLLLGIAAGAAWVGSSGGTAMGAVLRARNPDRTVIVLLTIAAAVAAVSAVWWALITVIAISLIAGFGQQLGRLSLDAIIQRDVPENMTSNAFARSETLLQLSWVVGGGIGIVLPLKPHLAISIAFVGLLAGLIFAARVQVTRR